MILRTDKAAFTDNYLKGPGNKTQSQGDDLRSVNGTPRSSNMNNNIRSGGVNLSNPVTNSSTGNNDVGGSGPVYPVRCPCGGNRDDGIMILCEHCKIWQHSVCFRITEEDAAPESHLCDICATESNGELVCTDPRLVQLSTEEKQELCLLRRSLVHCRSLDVIEPGQLSEILGVEITVGNGLFCALQADGVLTNPKRRNKNKGLCKVVDKTVLEERLATKYFQDIDGSKSVPAVVAEVVPEPPMAARKRSSNNAVTNLSNSANTISLEDHNIDILNASQDSMLNDAPSKKKRRACVVKTPVVSSRH